MSSPTGLGVRIFVDRDSEVPGSHPREEFLDQIAFTLLNDPDEPARFFADTSIPAWWSADMIADQLLNALPPIDPDGCRPSTVRTLLKVLRNHDPAFVGELEELFERHSAGGHRPVRREVRILSDAVGATEPVQPMARFVSRVPLFA